MFASAFTSVTFAKGSCRYVSVIIPVRFIVPHSIYLFFPKLRIIHWGVPEFFYFSEFLSSRLLEISEVFLRLYLCLLKQPWALLASSFIPPGGQGRRNLSHTVSIKCKMFTVKAEELVVTVSVSLSLWSSQTLVALLCYHLKLNKHVSLRFITCKTLYSMFVKDWTRIMNICLQHSILLAILYIVLLPVTKCWIQRGLKHIVTISAEIMETVFWSVCRLNHTLFSEH